MIELRTLGSIELHGADGRALQSILVQPKRVALLAYIAFACPRGFHRRDTLLALFWPDLDESHARAALRKCVYHLRQSLGDDVVAGRGEEELGLAHEAVWCDAVAFESLLSQGKVAAAIELYRGDFMAGFHVADAANFASWLDAERGRLRRQAARAYSLLAAQQEAADPDAAIAAARRAVVASYGDELPLQRLVSLLDRLGDRAGAIRAYEDYRVLLAEQYGLEPSAETEQLVAAVRSRTAGRSTLGTADQNPDARTQSHANGPPASPTRPTAAARALTHVRWMVAAIAGALTIIGATHIFGARTRDSELPVIAVGHIQDYSASGAASLAGLFVDMLSTNLARTDGLKVVSNARMYELIGQLHEADASTARVHAARRAGATELVDGALYRHPGGMLRFDLRRVTLEGGMVRAAYSVEGNDVFALVERATAELAAGLRLRTDANGVRTVTTPSVTAYRLYEEGLREFYQHSNVAAAARLFEAALQEDSAFALAAYYAYAIGHSTDATKADRFLLRAMRTSARGPDRERLLIRTLSARYLPVRTALAVAETLATRYPAEPDGAHALGYALNEAGGFLDAITQMRRVVAMDSLSLTGDRPRCLACDAYYVIVDAYANADSAAAAVRAAHEYVRVRPQSGAPLHLLASVLINQGMSEQAREAIRRADRFGPVSASFLAVRDAEIAIRAADLDRADTSLLRLARDSEAARGEATWYRIIVLRNQGRLREARALSRELQQPQSASRAGRPRAHVSSALEAQVLYEQGRYREAADLFGAIAAEPPYESWRGAQNARHRTWMLTHRAAALAAAGKHATLLALADTIRQSGLASQYGRDLKLHHHVRALYHLATGDTASAEAELRLAVFSWPFGYTRTNLELARVLVARNRAREAIPILQAALRGSLQASNYYITHTAIHDLLARAFEAAGQADSAAAHYRWIERALRHADPQFQDQYEAARSRLASRHDAD